MKGKEYARQLEGYRNIQNEIEVIRKYALDPRARRGQVLEAVGRLHPKTLNLKVSEIRRETASTTTLRMVPAEGFLPPFQAGQYVNLFVDIGGVRTSRPYSISSPPNQTAYYDLTVRRVENGFVSSYLLDEVKPGDAFQSTGPAGHFHYNPLFYGNDLVFLAGGSGVTPFMSMIREVTDRGLDRRLHLVYGCRSEDDVIFGAELEDRAARHDDFTLHTVVSEPSPGYSGRTGFITADLLTGLLGGLGGKTFYVCGPEAMYAFVLPELEKLGLSRRRIRTEVFGPPSDVTTQPGWPEEVGRDAVFQVRLKSGPSLRARASEPLMNALEREGVVLPASCRSGECSLCRTKLLAGSVFHPPGAKIRRSDRKYGYIHPCLAYPLDDLELLI